MIVFLALVSPDAASGQHLQPAGIRSQTPFEVPRTHPVGFSRRDYIVIGLVAGGALSGYLAYIEVKNSDAIWERSALRSRPPVAPPLVPCSDGSSTK